MQIKQGPYSFVEYKAASRGVVMRTFSNGTSIISVGGSVVHASADVVGEHYPLPIGLPVMVDIADDGETVVGLSLTIPAQP